MTKISIYLRFIVSGPVTDPKVLIEGVLFRARYLGSTQLVCEGQPTKATRMMQAEEAVSRIKVKIIALISLKSFWGLLESFFLWLVEAMMNLNF